MIRKMLTMLLCLATCLCLAVPAMAETTATELVSVELSNGFVLPAPADYIALSVGMTDADLDAIGLTAMGLTADYVDLLLTMQGMQADIIAPDFTSEYLFGADAYSFTDFADLTDDVLATALPTLETTLSATGVTIQNYDIARWDGNAYIVMEQYQNYQGAESMRLHAYTVKNGYAINVILMSYTGVLTEAHSTLLDQVIRGLQFPE